MTSSPRRLMWLCGILTAALALLLVLRIVHAADSEGWFVDEIVNSQAALNLLRTGNYTSVPIGGDFPPGISSGIAATWLAGLVWSLGGGLFIARIAAGLLIFAQVLALTWAVARRLGLASWLAAAMGALAFAVAFNVVPYNVGFIRYLGEFQGALFIGWALVAADCLPLAFLLLGTAVWGCKFMYLVPAVFIAGALLFTMPAAPLMPRLRRIAGALAMFILPLLCWGGLVVAHGGWSAAGRWLEQWVQFIIGGNSGMDAGQHLSLLQRLTSPDLEWSHLPRKIQWRMLVLLVGPALLAGGTFLLGALRVRRERAALLVLAALAGGVFLYAWFFFVSPTMWARHLQPGIYLMMGLGTALVMLLARRVPARVTAAVIVLALVSSLSFEIIKIYTSRPLVAAAPSYARQCRDLLTDSCNNP